MTFGMGFRKQGFLERLRQWEPVFGKKTKFTKKGWKMKEQTLADDMKIDALLAASPAPRVTKQDISDRINGAEYVRIGETVTVCAITLDNGFTTLGESACVNPENYNEEIGQRIAFDNAFAKLWSLFGFLLAERNYEAKNQQPPSANPPKPVLEDAVYALHDQISAIHSESGVTSDVTAAVNGAITDALPSLKVA